MLEREAESKAQNAGEHRGQTIVNMKPNRILCTLLLAGTVAGQACALVPAGRKTRLTEGWEFIRQEMGSAWEVMRPVPGEGKPEAVPLWQAVTLPHCFNAADAVNPYTNYYQGAGWYRTLLDVRNPYPGGRVLLEFEGAGQKTDVYVYTDRVASHVGGYDEWTADLTEAVEAFRRNPACQARFGGKIPVAVRCDNSRDTEMIPSDMSDFNLYGGLYRYVNLVYLPSFGCPSLRLDASVDERGKEGLVRAELSLEGGIPEAGAEVRLRLCAPDGTEVCAASASLSAAAPCVKEFALRRPALWSPDAPHLYTCTAELSAGGDTLRAACRFGFRHIRFEENGPFYLNGKRLLLRGTHRHEDHAGVGAAMTEAMTRAEMEQIKAMGANFIRLGHYQQSAAVLGLCDELGLMVWEEIPWCRGGVGGETYRAQARRMLGNMIAQHRSHPSVILWGLGNENDWPGDFEQFEQDSIRAFMSELNALSHRLDPSRPTVIRRCDFCRDIVDVYSPTIWAGWYSRRFRDYREMETAGMESVPRFLHAEWGGDSHAGRHAEERRPDGSDAFDITAGDRNGDWSESYIVRLFDWHLKEQETMPRLTGSAFWTFKDFSTPLRPDNPVPYVNQKGVVQRDGTPKESYYVVQSYWSREPMLRLYGHTWPVRWGRPGEPKEILAYSNCAEVELFVNGVSQGVRKRDPQDFPAAGFHWSVPLREGRNEVVAVARQGKTVLRDSIAPSYQTAAWGKPSRLLLTLHDEGEETALVEAQIVDEAGTPCLDARDFIEFGCTDNEALVADLGTVQGSLRVQAANGRAAIRVRKGDSPVVASACSKESGLKAVFVSVPGR